MAAEIVVGDDGEGVAAVKAGICQLVRVQRVALGPHQGGGGVDQRHQRHADHAGLDGAARHGAGLRHPQLADGEDHNDAKGQTGQGVQRVVALEKAGKKGAALISPADRNR